jgi:hypothetical protein
MKNCNYCGKQDYDLASTCRWCNWELFEAQPAHISESLDPHVEEDYPAPAAVRKGEMISLKCRTPGEAYLALSELERADIIGLLADRKKLMGQHLSAGPVEVLVSARAYEPLTELRRVVEFRHNTDLSKRRLRLSYFEKIFASGLGVVTVPGLLIYTWLHERYKAKGDELRAKELRLWFMLGAMAWLVVLGYCFLFI